MHRINKAIKDLEFKLLGRLEVAFVRGSYYLTTNDISYARSFGSAITNSELCSYADLTPLNLEFAALYELLFEEHGEIRPSEKI